MGVNACAETAETSIGRSETHPALVVRAEIHFGRDRVEQSQQFTRRYRGPTGSSLGICLDSRIAAVKLRDGQQGHGGDL